MLWHLNNKHSVPFFFSFLWRLPCRPQADSTLPFLRPFKLESTSISTWILLSNASKASARKSLLGLLLRGRSGEEMWTWPLFIGLALAKPIEKWAPFPAQQKGNRKRIKLPFPSHLPSVEDWGKEIFLNTKQLQSNLSNTEGLQRNRQIIVLKLNEVQCNAVFKRS